MNATLDQSLSWTEIPGAHYDVRVRNFNNVAIVYQAAFDTGAAASVGLAALLAGIDFSSAVRFWIDVRSKLPGGGLESSWSTALDVTITGFGVPAGLTIG